MQKNKYNKTNYNYGLSANPGIVKAIIIASAICLCILFVFLLVCSKISGGGKARKDPLPAEAGVSDCPVMVTENYLTPNKYSRPQTPIEKVRGIVVHYTANPGTDAQANRNYFEGLASSGSTYASSHYVIGLDGSVIQCIPLDEISYASNERNNDTISIECCHPDKSGKFTEQTYDTLVKLVAWLCDKYGLESNDVIRHYDVTGKMCPKYYVKHEKKWEKFKEDVKNNIKPVS